LYYESNGFGELELAAGLAEGSPLQGIRVDVVDMRSDMARLSRSTNTSLSDCLDDIWGGRIPQAVEDLSSKRDRSPDSVVLPHRKRV
jgi:hypothetical protein